MDIRTRIAVFYTNHKKELQVATLPMIAIVAVGSFMLFTHAAGSVVSGEAESGTKSTQAKQVADATASGGQAVKFAAPVVSGGTDFCSTSPALPSVKPTAANTGVPAGTTLSASGTITVTTPGTVIDGKDVTGSIKVNANNVTIKNSKIHTSGGYWAIFSDIDPTGTKIINNEIYSPSGFYTGITLNNVFICGNYIHGFDNMITGGDNMTIQANYMDKFESVDPSPHFDGIEIYWGNNTKVWGNNILMQDVSGNWLGDTGAINLTTENSNIDNVDIRGNWIGGGSYTLYVVRSTDHPTNRYTNISVVNNRWYGSAPNGYAMWGPVSSDDPITTWSGNVWDATGQIIP
ncbi:MAG: right-handed parallel beta-helix repeat-containing protein [Candidatus Saccharimonadales bacterium]